jgi:hypothetical protein
MVLPQADQAAIYMTFTLKELQVQLQPECHHAQMFNGEGYGLCIVPYQRLDSAEMGLSQAPSIHQVPNGTGASLGGCLIEIVSSLSLSDPKACSSPTPRPTPTVSERSAGDLRPTAG